MIKIHVHCKIDYHLNIDVTKGRPVVSILGHSISFAGWPISQQVRKVLVS